MMLAGLILLLLPSCMTLGVGLEGTQREYGLKGATKESFAHCAGHGCVRRKMIGLNEAEWSRISEAFASGAQGADAAAERERIRHAIAEMEKIVGQKTGTHRDVGGSFAGTGRPGQMDCVDEMSNVATYLTIFIDEGLIQQHRLGRRYTNHIFKTSWWPHTATSIVQKDNGQEFIVDSWWLKNGSLPYIVTLEEWSEGEWDRPMTGKTKREVEATMDL